MMESMKEFLRDRVAVVLIVLALFVGGAIGSAVTWLVVDNGPPFSCFERGGVIIIEGYGRVRCTAD